MSADFSSKSPDTPKEWVDTPTESVDIGRLFPSPEDPPGEYIRRHEKRIRPSASNELHRTLHDSLVTTWLDKATRKPDWEPPSEEDILQCAMAVDGQSSRAPDLPADTLEQIQQDLKRIRREARVAVQKIRDWAGPGRSKYARPESASKVLAGTIDTVKLLIQSPDNTDTPASPEREPFQSAEEWWAQAPAKAKDLADCIDEALDSRSARLGDTPSWDFVIGMLDVWVGISLNPEHAVLALAAETVMTSDEKDEVSKAVGKVASYTTSESPVEPIYDLLKPVSVSMANRRWDKKAQRAQDALEFFALPPS